MIPAVRFRFSHRRPLLTLLLALLSLGAQAQATWTGATSTDWATASNWSTGAVPTATDDVTVPSGPTNQPTLSSAGAVAKSVEVQGEAKLTIASGGALTINGSKLVSSFLTGFYNGGTVENSGQLTLGNTASVGDNGLVNQGAFKNKAGGQIAIDRASFAGVRNDPGGFTNAGTLTIGAKASVGQDGLFNTGGFQNTGCSALLNIVPDSRIFNFGSITNSGLILENYSSIIFPSSISSNSGIVVNKNGGTFDVGEGPNQPLAVVAANATQCAQPNGSIQLTGLKASTPYTLRYTLNGGSPILLSPDSTATASGTLTIPALGPGTYALTLSGSCVPLPISLVASLTGPSVPRIESITPSGAVCGGQAVPVSVTATGLSYQWYRQVGSSVRQLIPGATSASPTIPVQFLPGTLYVVVSSGCGKDSAFVTLTFKAPTLLRVSSSVASVCEGGSLTLSVAGSGPGSLGYVWTKGSGGPVLGQGSSLTLQNVQPSDAATYVCTLTSECQSVSESIPVTVRYVRISQQPPATVNLCSGSTTLTVGVQAAGITPTYQWRRNGTAIAGATSASLTVLSSRPGTYTVEVRSACGNVVSQASVVGCGNARLSAEEPALAIVPNPAVGGAIRVRVSGLDNPAFSLTTATGQSLGVAVKTDPGSPGGGWVLTPRQPLPTGVYVLTVGGGTTRLKARVLVAG